MAEVFNVSASEKLEQYLCNNLIADLMQNRHEEIEAAKKRIMVDGFNHKKRQMSNMHDRVADESDINILASADDQRRYAANVTMEMPAWTYFQIMLGTGDQNFWSDETNRKKFLAENPEYSTKNFK